MIPSVQIGLDLDRPDLDHRIDLRTKQMYDDGFIEEVERLRRIWCHRRTCARLSADHRLLDGSGM